MPDCKPIILTRSEVRELLQHGQAELRRPVRSGTIALQVTWTAGQRFWVREGFACRREGESIRVRFAVDRGQADERVRKVPIGPGLWRFATTIYRWCEAKYMPREFSRMTLELVAVREEVAGDRRGVLLRVRAVSQ
jgi:hypothetical protein